MPVNLYYTQRIRGFQQESVKYTGSRILQTENSSTARNFEHKGAIKCVKDRRRDDFKFQSVSCRQEIYCGKSDHFFP